MREKIDGVALRGAAACVPGRILTMDDFYSRCGDGEMEKRLRHLAESFGLERHHVVRSGTTAVDLAHRAGSALLERLQWEPESVDVVMMLTQMPDNFVPPVGYRLHERLGLSQKCMVLDLTTNCAFPCGHALWLAAGMIARGAARRILVAIGDTASLDFDPEDLINQAWVGDAGGAMALESDPSAGTMSFVIKTNSQGVDAMWTPGRGYRRTPAPPYYVMDGQKVALATNSMMRAGLADIAEYSGRPLASIDMFYLHQIGERSLSLLARAGKFDTDRMASSIGRYGCCWSSDITLLMSDTSRHGCDEAPRSVVLCAFGAGYACSATHMTLERFVTPGVVYAEEL